MTTVQVPVRDITELVRDQQQGFAAWQRDLEARLARDPEAESDREAQMDARRRLAGLHRTRSAVQACQARRERGLPATGEHPRAVLVHRSTWMRARLAQEFDERGIQVVGEAEDGAVAVAMAVIEQPELLLLEDRLPWVTPIEVVEEVHRYAPHTVVAVQMEDSAEAPEMLEAGATAVFSRGVHPAQLCECCVDVLVAEVLERSA
jgi:CheY-like chemotaxis protein